MSGRARPWLHEPLLHFLTAGVALFVLYTALGPRHGTGDEIVVTRGRVRSIAETFAGQWHRAPSREELAGLVGEFVREEVLVREALALGLDRGDAVIRRRLAQKMEFISDDVAAASEPTAEELRAFLAGHPERFRLDARVTFSQVFLDPGKRGAALAVEAAQLLAALNTPGAVPDLAVVGDARMLETRFADVALGDVQVQFGERFAARLEQLSLGRFEGPIESGYGAHLVRLEALTPARVPALEEVRDAVARDWSATKRLETSDVRFRSLLARYRLVVEDPVGTDLERIARAR